MKSKSSFDMARIVSGCPRLAGLVFSLLGTFLLGPSLVGQEVVLDFDDEGPLVEAELPDWFDFYGFDPTVGANWTIDFNVVNAGDPSNALRTTSEGERLEEFFSRVAIVKEDVFEGQDVQISVDITWDDNDNCGVYLRFKGESDVPLGNEYYYLRVDIDDGPPSSVYLYRVKGGTASLLVQATDDPFPISPGETHTVTFAARCDELFASIDDIEVTGMDPFVDPDPLLGPGRVGVGHNTNPSYYDNFILTVEDAGECACAANRSLSTRRFVSGGTVSATVTATNVQGATMITETFPATWVVTDAGGGNVAGNTITFDVTADGDVTYELMVPDEFCEAAEFSGRMEGAGGCSTDIAGDSRLTCIDRPAGAQVLDFDNEGPLSQAELRDFFDFYGFDRANWTVEVNGLNPADSSNALRTTSEGEQLEEYFSRVAILKSDVFEGQDVQISVDITWDDNDNCGVYLRFNGESDVPLENDYYFVRVDIDDGPPSSVYLYRVRDGLAELLIQATDDPFAITPGETHTVTFAAEEDALFVALDGVEVTGMDPFIDPDPLLVCGRVGVGHNTNPSYYDNFILTNSDVGQCGCAASRSLSARRFDPGGAVSATVSARNIQGATTITETFPATWVVTDAGGGSVAGNTITFNVNADGDVSYQLMVPDGFCESVLFRGELAGAGGCGADVGGDSEMFCSDIELPPGAEILDFDNEGPTDDVDLLDFFDLYGFDPTVGSNWTIEPNGVNAENPSNALRTTSEGEQLAEYFSRVAILKEDVFEAEDVFFAVDITWDDNDNCGVYARFNEGPNPDDPLGNDYYYVRVDIDDGPPSSVYLYRVRDGLDELLIQATNDPFPISPGETHTVTFVAEGAELSVMLDGLPVGGMDPFVDPDPLEGPGRVGVGHNTNPSYYDNLRFADLEILPPVGARLRPGDVNGDGILNLTDAVAHLGFLFGGGDGGGIPDCYRMSDSDQLSEAGMAIFDFNGDDFNNLTDAVAALGFLFSGGASHVLGAECTEVEGDCEDICQ